MNAKDWLILKTIDEEKSITKAAQRLFISQPAISYRIQQLEKEFNTKLLITDHKKVTFTMKGELLLEHCKNMLLQEQRIKDTLTNIGEDIEGTLRLGVSNNYVHYKLAPILKSFLEQYPKVKVVLKTGISEEIMELLTNNEVHIGIENRGYDWKDHKISLGEESIIAISKHKIQLSELSTLKMIKYKMNPSLNALIDSWWQENFSTPPTVHIEVNYVETCKEMVKNDLGFAVIPEFCLKNHDSLYSINLLDKNGEKIFRNTWMYYRNTSLQITTVKKFIDFIKAASF